MRRPSRTAKRSSAHAGRLQRAVPAAGIDADRAHLDAMVAGVAHDLGRGVEAHRLGVEQRGAEDVGMVAFHPGRGIGDQREAGGVALGEAVAAEALESAESVVSAKLRRVAVARSCRRSACRGICETPPVCLKVAMARRSWSASPAVKPAQTMATCIACSWNSGTPRVLPSTSLELRCRIRHRLLALAAAQIGMDHVALDRARAGRSRPR